MAGWRKLAETIRQGGSAEHIRHNEHDRTIARLIEPIVPIVPATQVGDLRQWHARLRALDIMTPPAGIPMGRWQDLFEDSYWLYENFAAQAVRSGWSAEDLFGILPFDLKLGGLVARLQGARNLKLEGEKAVWSHCSVHDWTCRGAGDHLVASGLKLIWEFQ